MKYREKIINDGLLVKKVIEEIPTPKQLNKAKGEIRKQIESEVYDLSDSIADNNKLIFILMAFVKRMYDALPAATKNKMKDKELIDSLIEVYENSQNLAEIQIKKEGVSSIKRIFEKQNKIAGIVEKYKYKHS